ncbi:transglutaminase-like cysteine peptidase [Novosphingobium flavum]|uniref:Transglutaminase-like cysteine peptidase n=1 Tax=Novosphingobium flavum TaxID=1778672 RepID=A0A7X1FUS9_9SPHN|nr:transglutaminase-like cysteine peptidase [Novosphingobium flavum]MBC2667366.1 transglutaminase-like cysteine peptidase [Novosphingobium flavum]
MGAPGEGVHRKNLTRLCRAAITIAAALAGGAQAVADTPISAGPVVARIAGGEVVTRWAMPAIAVPEAVRPVGPNVFGTVALPVRAKPTSTRWAKVMRASLNQPGLDRMMEGAWTLSTEQAIGYVQASVNRTIRNGAQATNCSDDGYWAPAQETLARGLGDCFDVAIAKMEALRRLGIPDRDLYLTTGWFGAGAYAGARGRESVALLVRVGEHFWLLPEHSDRVYESGVGAPQFTPVVTYGVGMTWVHGKVLQIAALTPAPGAAAAPVVATGIVSGPVR